MVDSTTLDYITKWQPDSSYMPDGVCYYGHLFYDKSISKKDLPNGKIIINHPTEALPNGLLAVIDEVTETAEGYEYDYSGNIYIEKDDIICKIMTPDTFKYMSAFEVGTEFFNPRSLTTNHYLTWGFSKPDRLKGMPLVTVTAD